MYLLDTNILSELRRRSRPVIDWLDPIDPHDLFVSVVSLGEIAKGAELKARRDERAATVLVRWLISVRQQFEAGILPVTDEMALEWGRLEAQRPRGADGLIAATAIVRGLTLVTRNVADFEDVPVRLFDPWRSPL